MTGAAKQFLALITFAAGWSVLLSLFINRAHPAAVFIVWLIGLVWGIGYIAAGQRDADLLLKRWLQMMLAAAVLGSIGAALLS